MCREAVAGAEKGFASTERSGERKSLRVEEERSDEQRRAERSGAVKFFLVLAKAFNGAKRSGLCLTVHHISQQEKALSEPRNPDSLRRWLRQEGDAVVAHHCVRD